MSRRLKWRPPRAFDGSDHLWPVAHLQALSYVVGVLLKGDGSVYFTSQEVLRGGILVRVPVPRIELKNKSTGFLGKFDEECAKVLRRRRVRISRPNSEGHMMVRYRAKDFVLWWQRRNLSNLKGLIEAFPIAYLRGRFDSDGSVGKYRVDLVGIEPHRKLMNFERLLCRRLGMRVSRIRSYGKVGEVTFAGSKEIVSRQPKIRFSVNTRDFAKTVGNLNVEWKQAILDGAAYRRQWTPWPWQLRARAEGLWAGGMSCKQVSDQLSREFLTRVPYDTVYAWMRKGAKT
ncbi:MAG: hypothetical protein LYZ69_08470 [Nitrososphaerales archaeon]|nr:hypothetical protein [Nitrososphaerales archaeon]